MRLIPILLALLLPFAASAGTVLQPFTPSNTVAAAIGDSHGYQYPNIMFGFEQWLTLKAFTNGVHGSKSVIYDTNNWATRIKPWFQQFTNGETKLLLDTGSTIDLINGITVVGGLDNYKTIKSNMWEEMVLEGIKVVRPTIVPIGTDGWNAATDAINSRIWSFNNWLARTRPELIYAIPDFFRRFSNNKSLETWFSWDGVTPELYHLNPAGEYLQAVETDVAIRFGLRPMPYMAEQFRDWLEIRNDAGDLMLKVWASGAIQDVRGSKDGTFDYGFVAGAGGHFTGITGGASPALVLVPRTNQTAPLLEIGGTKLYHTGKIYSRGEPLDIGHIAIAPNGTVQFYGPNNEWYDMHIAGDGGFAVYNVRSNSSKMFHVAPNGNATFSGNVTAKGFISTE